MAAAVLTLPVFRLVARCTDPKPPSPIGSGAISQRALSALNFVSLPLESLPPPQQPIVQVNQLRATFWAFSFHFGARRRVLVNL